MAESSFTAVELALTTLLRSIVPAGVEVTSLSAKLASEFKAKKGLTGRVNVALFRVEPSPTTRNVPERPDVSGRIQPKAAFAMSYLITAYSAATTTGNSGTAELLECALRGLVTQPVLALPEMATAANQQGNVRVDIQSLSLENWTSLWTALQTELRPAVVCVAEPVIVIGGTT